MVLSMPSSEALSWLLMRHYAHRKCPISFAFGLYVDGHCHGVVTYGTPASSNLRDGVCGKEWSDRVLELNRLCCDNTRNTASELVGSSLRMLPKPSVVVSYADTAQGHIGYVYQATNFLYTGLSAKRTDWKVKGMEHKHGATIADESRGQEHRAQWMREKYGDDFYLSDRPRKHRYVFFVGSRRDKHRMLESLHYDVLPYPKGKSMRYNTETMITSQSVLQLH